MFKVQIFNKINYLKNNFRNAKIHDKRKLKVKVQDFFFDF